MAYPKICFIVIISILSNNLSAYSQIIHNKNFSLGSYGRVGVGFSPQVQGKTGRQLNLLGQGSIGGRFEEQDYIELINTLHFKPVNINKDTTYINAQLRLNMFASGRQSLGNVTTKSQEGITIGMPEFFVEAKNINGTDWSAWVGSKYYRTNDIHINDYYYFDDHSSTGFGVSKKQTALAFVFPALIDSTTTYPPYSYYNMIDGTPVQALRQRYVGIAEHTFLLPGNHSIKLMGEYHYMSKSSVSGDSLNYPTDDGWVAGIKHDMPLRTNKGGSFNQLSVRFGRGIANGGDGGSSRTWLTYGPPDAISKKYNSAYSFTAVEHFLLNLSDRFSVNGYGMVIKSRGGATGNNKEVDYSGKLTFNRKTDIAFGVRTFVYLSNWFHILNEAHYTMRKDGIQPFATMLKFSVAPTLVPTGERGPWARPHLRFVLSAARYNDFASKNLYSSYLRQAGVQTWGLYAGIKAEWWLF